MRMEWIAINPGVPYYAFSAAFGGLAALCLLRIERTRTLMRGVRELPSRHGLAGRLLLGQLVAVPCALIILMTALASGASGNQRWLAWLCVLGTYSYIGLVLPRRPIVQLQRDQRRLRRLTPGFVSYVRISLEGHEDAALLLHRYIERPDPQHALMQMLVREALSLMQEKRLGPFAALRVAARARRCQELVDVAEALAQTEDQGTDPRNALEAHERTLAALLNDEFKRMLKRRVFALLGMVAVTVVGILGLILWVFSGGGSVLGKLG